MFEIFSDIFACRENLLTKIDPRSKIIISLGLIFVVLLSTHSLLPLLIFHACMFTMVALKIPSKLVMLRFAAPFGVVGVLMVVQTFFTEGVPLFTLSMGSLKLVATKEGLQKGILMSTRVLGAVGVMLLFSAVTPAYKVFNALRWFRVPEEWVEVALLVYRYVFNLIEQTSDVIAAQRVRLGYSGITRCLSSAGVLTGTVLLRSMDQAVRTHEAMMLRGGQGKFPFGPLPNLTISDRAMMSAGPLLSFMALALVESLL